MPMFETKPRVESPTKRRSLLTLPTPCLILDADRMDRNVDRLRRRLGEMGVTLRPHLKTAKSVEIARRLMVSPEGPATVSTLEEAEHFADAGVRNLTYAVGIAPTKLARIVALLRRDIDISVILDSVEQADAVATASKRAELRIPTLIEIDCDGQRSGVRATDAVRLISIARALEPSAEFRGVLVHAGGSYDAKSLDALKRWAELERQSALEAAKHLGDAGFRCRVVSVGSTPTAHQAENFAGVTEVRAGTFVFFDLVQAGLGVCETEDIALSVLATVIGVQPEAGRIIVDAGWMALSSDRGTASQAVDQGYGLVCDCQGTALPDLIVASTNQEHGILKIRAGSDAVLPDLRLGDRVRILPNHACATAAQHGSYQVVRQGSPWVEVNWPRIKGW
jgi:D-serine deaminase-like pyridoxal phosphate-dependent protein